MLRQILGELVAGELVVDGYAPHHTCLLQIYQVAVHRAARQARPHLADVTYGHGMPRVDQELYNRPPAAGESPVKSLEALRDELVELLFP